MTTTPARAAEAVQHLDERDEVVTKMPPDPVPVDASTLDRTDDSQIKNIVEHLQWRYSREQISLPDLSARVNGFYHQFDTVRIRTFVTILVEGLVRRSIPVVLPGHADIRGT